MRSFLSRRSNNCPLTSRNSARLRGTDPGSVHRPPSHVPGGRSPTPPGRRRRQCGCAHQAFEVWPLFRRGAVVVPERFAEPPSVPGDLGVVEHALVRDRFALALLVLPGPLVSQRRHQVAASQNLRFGFPYPSCGVASCHRHPPPSDQDQSVRMDLAPNDPWKCRPSNRGSSRSRPREGPRSTAAQSPPAAGRSACPALWPPPGP